VLINAQYFIKTVQSQGAAADQPILIGMISLPGLEIFLLRRIANAAEELETYDTSSEVPNDYIRIITRPLQ
jgi:hypothetical protein